MADPTLLKIVHEAAPGGCIIRVSGVIDTHLDRRKLLDGARGVVVIDLDQVPRITSYGVREWLKALQELEVEYYCFIRCRPALVMQFNTMLHFAHKGELLSFYLPYACEHCGRNVDLLLDLRTQYQEVRAFQPPPERCKDCGHELVFDDDPRSYFSFAAKARIPAPPPLVDALISGQALRPGATFELQKDVQESHTALWFSGNLDRSTNLRRIADGLEGTVLVIADRVESVTPEGLSKLASFVQVAEATVVFARAAQGLAVELVTRPEFAKCHLHSIWVQFPCKSCGSELTLDLRAGNPVEPGELICPDCRRPLEHPNLAAALELAAKRPLIELSLEAEGYLRRNLRPPVGSPLDALLSNPNQSFGRYQLIRLLGSGGMAEVFLARQIALAGFQKQVVIKRLLPHISNDQSFIDMFLEEARLSARISHPNVVQIFDVGREGKQHYIAMEYVRGWDLNVILQRCSELGEPLPVALAARVVAEICAGLQAAHQCSDEEGHALTIIHRDISPHNVLISCSGQVKLTDFGIAKAVDSRNRTPTSTIKGKLTYMAPEQARGEEIDVRADLFPAGLILYECLTLKHVVDRDTEQALKRAMVDGPAETILTLPPGSPPGLQRILDRATARDRNQRYASAGALREDLEALIASLGQPSSADDLSAWLGPRIPRQELLGLTPIAGAPRGATPTYIRSRPPSEPK